ncbi:MAG: sulfatase [Planctomycetes bacterium]|nr:sulfatase [Planctomycetota bacterium]
MRLQMVLRAAVGVAPLLVSLASTTACSGKAASGAPRALGVAPAVPITEAAPAASTRVAPSDAFNVLIVTIDTLRADHLSCYGYPRSTTPRIDEVARSGTLFTRCLVQWPKTGPSMASMLTSTYGSTSGVARTTLRDRIPLSYDLLSELLQRGGWETMGVVSNLSLAPKFQFDQGFERFVVVENPLTAEHVAADARQLWSARDRSRPYFGWIHFLDPHAPYQPPKAFRSTFVDDALFAADERAPVKVDPRAIDASAPGATDPDVGQIPAYAYLEGKDRLRDYVAAYDGEIRYLDHQLGLLFDWLRAEGDLERTIVVITADHGESLGEHDYFFEHGRFPYDDCQRVPLIIHHPEWPVRTVDAPVALMDLAPTLLELLGLQPGWQFEGHSLRSWLDAGAPSDAARPVFSESGYSTAFEVSLHHGRFKLIRIGSKYIAGQLTNRPYELYDIEADPGELVDVSAEHPDVFESMREVLDAYVAAAYAKVPPDSDGSVVPTAEERAAMDALGYANDEASGRKIDAAGDGATPPRDRSRGDSR